MTYADLQAALRILGLCERATLRDIKTRHREMVKRHHPDADVESEPETIRQINAAYSIIVEYITEYRYSFAETEFYEQNPEERIRQQFMNDPLWGKG